MAPPLPTPQTAAGSVSGCLTFCKRDDKAKGGSLLRVRSHDNNVGTNGGRRVAVQAVNGGAVKVNGAAVAGGVRQAPAPSPPSSSSIEGDGDGDAFRLGTFVEGRLVYRQQFVIRSYEIGPDRTATMETLMNLLQQTALNHVTCSGLAGDIVCRL